MSSQFEQGQADLFGRLSQGDYFNDIPVKLFRPRSEAEAVQIQSDIDAALAGLETKATKSGAAVIVMLPSANVPEPDVPGPRFDVVYLIRVYENPLVNMGSSGTQKSAEEISLNVLNLLHHFVVQDFGAVFIADANALRPVPDESGRIVYDCAVKMQIGLAKGNKTATPTINGTTLAVTLATATSMASIYYTIDGSYPWSGNDDADLYVAPFNVDAGTIVRAVATKTGLQASDVASKTISA